MVDFYFITSVINMIWQIFTILFVLYRFTSFFNMLYNFTKFLGRLFKGLIYVKDQISLYITRHSGYSYSTHNTSYRTQTTFEKIYNNIKSWFIKTPSTTIPLFETRESYINNLDSRMDSNLHSRMDINIDDTNESINSSRNDTDFEYHLNNMLDSDYNMFKRQSYMTSSLYPPLKRPLSNNLTQTTQTTQIQQNFTSVKKHKSDEENILYSPVPVNPVKKEMLHSDFLANFLNSTRNKSDEHEQDIENDQYIEQPRYYQNNESDEQHEMKMSLLNNSYDNFDGNLNNNLDDQIV